MKIQSPYPLARAKSLYASDRSLRRKNDCHALKGFLVFLLGASLLAAPWCAWAHEEIPIYYSSPVSAKDRQGVIKEEFSKQDLEPVVFGKFRDFAEEIKNKAPKVVIAPSFFDKYHPDYKPVLRWIRPGGSSFKYLLLSTNGDADLKKLPEFKVGVVEETDRDDLKGLITGLFAIKFKMVKSVSKPEDLFPLLVFKAVDCILLSPDDLEQLKEKFTAKLQVVTESKAVPVPTVFVRKGVERKEFIEKLQQVPLAVLKRLGFSKFEIFSEGGAQ